MDLKVVHYLNTVAYQIRVWSLIMTTNAGSGHPTSALSAADILSVLFFNVMKFNPFDPFNPNNDRFILSKGHASSGLYAVYKQLGILTEEDLMGYRSFGSFLEGHPTPRFIYSEAATGSLGQGLSIGVGMALSARLDQRDFKTFVLLGDSECAEGSVWEAAQLAAYYKLNNVRAILDCNSLGQSTKTMEGYDTNDFKRKFESFGWYVEVVNGNAIPDLIEAFEKSNAISDKPIIIIAKTYKGYGIDGVENKQGFHGKVFSKEELPDILAKMKKRFSEAALGSDYVWKPKLPTHDNLKEKKR